MTEETFRRGWSASTRPTAKKQIYRSEPKMIHELEMKTRTKEIKIEPKKTYKLEMRLCPKKTKKPTDRCGEQ